MNDLAMHILDIVQNSISAGARNIIIRIIENLLQDLLSLTIIDDGKGMSPEIVKKVADPYCTSRTTRKVGLGIPLLKQSAEQTGGGIVIKSELGKGTEITARFVRSNIDIPPMGNIANAYVLLMSANPDINMVLEYSFDDKSYRISTEELKEALDGMPVNDPSVVKLVEEMVQNNISDLKF